jgi:hypothetical protein
VIAATPVAGSAQRMQALARANEVRVARAALKRRVGRGETSVVEAILSGAPEIQSMAVIELLLSQRSWGHARCYGVLMAIPLSENKPIGSMTDRQQRVLVATLRAASQPLGAECSLRRHNRQTLGLRQAVPG